MQYVEPSTIAEAIRWLADDSARPLAGGATLVAMLNEGLLAPERLVSLRRITGLDSISRLHDGRVSLGAMVRHVQAATSTELTAGHQVVGEAAAQIAHPTIRNMGTIGGSIAHADPNADYPCALLACGATVRIAGAGGERTESIDTFFQDYMTTTLEQGELVIAVELDPPSGDETSAYLKFSRVDGDYATVSVGVRLGWGSGRRCMTARVAIGSCHLTPLRRPEAEAVLVDGNLSADAIDEAARILVAALDPVDDFRGSADYRRMLVPGLLSRTLTLAKERHERSAEK